MYFCENDKIMGENHLTYFKIENFKRFDSFEMENLGQFNLLVGDNNVGKTSVLEGLLFDEDIKKWLVGLFGSLIIRKLITKNDFSYSYITEILSKIQTWNAFLTKPNHSLSVKYKTNNSQIIKDISLHVLKTNELNETDKEFIISNSLSKESILWYRINFNDKYFGTFSFTTNNISPSNKTFNLLANNLGYTDRLVEKYITEINSDKSTRKLFDKTLSLIIPKLEETRLHNSFDNDCIGVSLNDDNAIQPITRFGDGAVKLARIIIGIISCSKDKDSVRIMIDEIENGIHFSRLKDFWKTVITLCKQFDVQLFATTHSLECQRYFVEALSELGEEYQKDARNISLLENAKGEVKSVTFDFEQFEFALSIGANTRGGQR